MRFFAVPPARAIGDLEPPLDTRLDLDADRGRPSLAGHSLPAFFFVTFPARPRDRERDEDELDELDELELEDARERRTSRRLRSC